MRKPAHIASARAARAGRRRVHPCNWRTAAHAGVSNSLYPSAPLDLREAVADDVLPGGFRVKKGWMVRTLGGMCVRWTAASARSEGGCGVAGSHSGLSVCRVVLMHRRVLCVRVCVCACVCVCVCVCLCVCVLTYMYVVGGAQILRGRLQVAYSAYVMGRQEAIWGADAAEFKPVGAAAAAGGSGGGGLLLPRACVRDTRCHRSAGWTGP